MKEYIRLADCLELLGGTSVCMWYITDWSETTNTERRRWQSAEQLRLGRPDSACIISPSYDRGARNAICSQRPRACIVRFIKNVPFGDLPWEISGCEGL